MHPKDAETFFLFAIAGLLTGVGCLIQHCVLEPRRRARLDSKFRRAFRENGSSESEQRSTDVTTIFTADALKKIFGSFSGQLEFDDADADDFVCMEHGAGMSHSLVSPIVIP